MTTTRCLLIAAMLTTLSWEATAWTLQELNRDLPMLAHRAKDLKKAATKFQTIDGLVDKIASKHKAAVRCPKPKGNNKRLGKAMRRSVNEFFGIGTHAKKVKILRLNGKMSVVRNAFRKEVTESYPAVACTKGLPKSQNAKVCQVFSISLKRTKVKGHPWGAWVTFVGHSEEMLCKNLK